MTDREELGRLLAGAVPETVVQVSAGKVELYSSAVADQMLAAGYLNLVLRRNTGELEAVSIADMESQAVKVEGQEKLKRPNASAVVGIWSEGDKLFAQHWDGFLSWFDGHSMELLGQRFTR